VKNFTSFGQALKRNACKRIVVPFFLPDGVDGTLCREMLCQLWLKQVYVLSTLFTYAVWDFASAQCLCDLISKYFNLQSVKDQYTISLNLPMCGSISPMEPWNFPIPCNILPCQIIKVVIWLKIIKSVSHVTALMIFECKYWT